MWFRRKAKNRRLGREAVLDVKLRSSQVRAARNRLAALGLSALFGLLLTAYLTYSIGELALRRLVYQNRAFALQDFDLKTDGVIALDQLCRWTGVKREDNLLALDLARVKQDLEMIPLIESASVERILPHTLRVRIVEREPVAQTSVPRLGADGIELAVFEVDARGFVMVPLDPRQRAAGSPPPEPLPALCGLNPGDVQPGHPITSPQVHAAIQLILAFDRSPLSGFLDLKRLDLSAPDVITATTSQGSEITFGLTDLDQQLRRWAEVFDGARNVGKAVASLDLAVTNNIPARWVEASAVPPTPPKAAKHLHPKRKHVSAFLDHRRTGNRYV